MVNAYELGYEDDSKIEMRKYTYFKVLITF